jgi:outer membrane protein assembly factor BamB
MRQGLVALDPSDGSTNFRYWFCSRTYESVNAARPVVIDDKILLSNAYRVGSALLQVAPDGMTVREVWKDERNLLAHWSTPIQVDGAIYGFSGRHEEEGELRCIDAATGDVVWQTTGFEGDTSQLAQDRATGSVIDRSTGKHVPFPFYGRGSKIQVEDKFVVLGERGTLALVKIDPTKWIELSRAAYEQISYPAWTAPVLSRKRLYLRDEDSLLCVDLAPSNLPGTPAP